MQSQRTLLWLLILSTAISVAVGAERQTAPKTILELLKPGQAVNLDEKDGRYEIGVFPQAIQPLSHTVIEIGQDYVVLRDFVGVTDSIVPIYSIKCIKVLRGTK